MIVLLFLGGFLLLSIGGHLVGFRYFLNLWYSADCFLNAVGGGDPRETMSSRFGKAVRRGNRFAVIVCRVLHFADKDHCAKAIEEKLGERGVPVGMMAVGLVWVVVLAFAFFGCSPVAGPVGDGLTDNLEGRVLHQFTGEPVAGVKVTYRRGLDVTDADGRFSIVGIDGGNMVSFRSPQILTRKTYAWGDSVWKVIPADFDTAAYRDLARSSTGSGRSIRWATSPTIYIDTRPHGVIAAADLEQWIGEVSVQAPAFVADWSSGTLPVAVVLTDDPPAFPIPGAIVIRFSELNEHYGDPAFIGFARVWWNFQYVITSADISLRLKQYRDNPGKRQGILGHELGHALGLKHMFEPVPSLMQLSIGSKTDLLAFDHLTARWHYGRVPANAPPDTDGRGTTSLELAHGGYWEGP